MTFFAGKGRDAGRDLDLGAACYPPVFIAAGLERALAALTGPQPFYASAADAVGAAGVAVLVWRAVRVARARPPATKADAGRGAAGRAGTRPARAGIGVSLGATRTTGARRRRRGARARAGPHRARRGLERAQRRGAASDRNGASSRRISRSPASTAGPARSR